MNKLSMAIAICLLMAGSLVPRVNQVTDGKISASAPQYSLVYAGEKDLRIAGDSYKKDGGNDMKKNDDRGGDGVLYRVMAIVLVIWMGLALYLFRMDRKIVKLEKDLNER
jgi:CcmD family protein